MKLIALMFVLYPIVMEMMPQSDSERIYDGVEEFSGKGEVTKGVNDHGGAAVGLDKINDSSEERGLIEQTLSQLIISCQGPTGQTYIGVFREYIGEYTV